MSALTAEWKVSYVARSTYTYEAVWLSCMGVVEKHLGKCGNITEFGGDEVCCGQKETTK